LAAGVTEVKLNPQVTVEFTGAIAQVRVTAELKLFNEVTVIVVVDEFPIVVVAEAGEADKLKSFTVNAYVVVRFCVFAFPVTVTVYVPVAAPVTVLTVKVDPIVPLAAGVTDAGEREQVTDALTGAIAQVNATAALKPFKEVTVIFDVPLFPIITVADAGDAPKLKSIKVSV